MDKCLNNRLLSSFFHCVDRSIFLFSPIASLTHPIMALVRGVVIVISHYRKTLVMEDTRESKRMMHEMGLTLTLIRETITPENSPRVEQFVAISLAQCDEILTRLDDFSLDVEKEEDEEEHEEETIIIEECCCVCF